MLPIAIVTAMPEELTPLLRRAAVERTLRIGGRRCYSGTLAGTPVIMMATGDGMEQAENSLSELLRQVNVSSVIGVGIAGALSVDLRAGDLVVAEGVRGVDGSVFPCDATLVKRAEARATRASLYTVSGIVGTAEEKRKLAAEADAVDTESHGWVRAASARNVPSVIVRVIFDTAEETLPPIVVSSVAPDGSIDRRAVLRQALVHPNAIPSLLQFRKRLQKCATTITEFVESFVAPAQAPLAQLEHFLQATSRTFALCVPLLPQPTHFEVTVAYLLFRIADTFEDASELPVATRTQALADFCALLRNPEPSEARRLATEWQLNHPTSHSGYLELLAHVPLVLEGFRSLSPEAMEIMRTHVIRSAEGMSQYVSRTAADGKLQLVGMEDLRRYCYTVAGIVGEMLTELFLLGSPRLASAASFLRARSAQFGEALQLVNILKDAADDRSEGRLYIPRGVDLKEVFTLARADLDVATEYTLMMQSEGAPRGVVAFAALPVALARATLDRVEKFGPGAKVSRPDVFRITRRLKRSLARNEPALARSAQRPSRPAWKRSIFSLLSGSGS